MQRDESCTFLLCVCIACLMVGLLALVGVAGLTLQYAEVGHGLRPDIGTVLAAALGALMAFASATIIRM